jgi:PadR family transcriptional regulator, regulatory protein PadR
VPDHNAKNELVQGTLDMLILRTLAGGPLHGYAIAGRIQQASDDFLKVEEGSLYPALHRMERRGWIEAQWGLSETKRKAKYYRLTATGRAQLKVAAKNWSRVVEAIAGVMGARPTTET